MPTQAVIFDMDGILIDSEPWWFQAEVAVFRAVGVPLTAEMCAETLGMRLDASVAHWYERYPWAAPTPGVVQEQLLDKACELIGAHGEPMAGVLTTLDLLKGAGMALGLASSSPMRLIEIVVDKLAIRDYFDVLCTAFDERLGKPDPAVYLTAARQLGVPPASRAASTAIVTGSSSHPATARRPRPVPPRPDQRNSARATLQSNRSSGRYPVAESRVFGDMRQVPVSSVKNYLASIPYASILFFRQPDTAPKPGLNSTDGGPRVA